MHAQARSYTRLTQLSECALHKRRKARDRVEKRERMDRLDGKNEVQNETSNKLRGSECSAPSTGAPKESRKGNCFFSF